MTRSKPFDEFEKRTTSPGFLPARKLMTLTGFGPILPRRGVNKHQEPTLIEPPEGLKRGRFYIDLKGWVEESRDGQFFRVICFACNGLWLKRWGERESENGLVVAPLIEGGLVVLPKMRTRKRCRCAVGSFLYGSQQSIPEATEAEVEEALEYDQYLANGSKGRFQSQRELRRLARQIENQAQAQNQPPESTNPPGSDSESRPTRDRALESKSEEES